LSSAGPLRNPNWIIDVTSPLNNCGGCTSNAMNSGNKKQSAWRTSDGSPWWLRSTKASQPSGDYLANCYMDVLRKPINENSITFNDNRCNVHSKSYYCQPEKIHLKPRSGSPNSCKCSQVDLAGSYSPGALIKCEQCISVSKAQQKNSCPVGMKIFSPRSRRDWRTFLKSAGPLRAPNWIIDVTRPSSGCGGCTRYAMKFTQPQQKTWRTTDGSGWWLRDRKYTHPNGDYSANCFMDLFKTPTSENTIAFDDNKCNVRSRSYYCQPIQKKKSGQPKPPPPPSERRLVAWRSLKQGIVEKVFYFKQGKKCPNLNNRNPNMMRRVSKIDYPRTKGKFQGFVRAENFAVRWDFFLIIKVPGTYTFYVTSDDGSKLSIDGKSVVNNDGSHSMRTAFGKVRLVKGQHFVFATMFQGKGASAMKLIYKGPDTEDRNRYVGSSAMYVPPKGFKEEVYYIKKMKSVPNLNRVAAMERIRPHVVYKETKSKWSGFRQASDVAVRWTGTLKIRAGGAYRWSLLSDDGSRLFLQREGGKWDKVVDNDGRHSLKNKESNYRASGLMKVKLEYFQGGGKSCMIFRYMGSDTRNKMKFVPQEVMLANL